MKTFLFTHRWALLITALMGAVLALSSCLGPLVTTDRTAEANARYYRQHPREWAAEQARRTDSAFRATRP